MRKSWALLLLMLLASLLLVSCGSLPKFYGKDQTSRDQGKDTTTTGKPVVIEFSADW